MGSGGIREGAGRKASFGEEKKTDRFEFSLRCSKKEKELFRNIINEISKKTEKTKGEIIARMICALEDEEILKKILELEIKKAGS